MKKLILTLTAASLLFSANVAQAGNDSDFVTWCNNSGGTIYQNLYIISLYSSDNTIGFSYSEAASLGGNRKNSLFSHRRANLEDGGSDDMLSILENAYIHELAVDVCTNSNGNFFAVEESEEQ